MRDFFVQRGWFGETGREPTTCLQFGTEREILGYAAVTVIKVGHPTRGASVTRRYLLVAQVGVASKFQGVRDPQGSATFATEIFEAMKDLARRQECTGLYLNVRKDNERAQRFYARLGFVPDGEYRSKRSGAKMLRQRPVI